MKKTVLFLCIIMVFAAHHSHGQAGVLDSSFGLNGMATFYQSNIVVLNKYALQQDGKIIAAGYTVNTANSDFCVARFHTDGSIDSTFGTNGVSIIPVTSYQDVAYALAVQPDDKIVIGGHSTGVGGTGVAYFSVARCNANGAIDSSFADNGTKIISLPGSYAEVRCIAIEQDSSKIVLAGISNFSSTNPNPAVVRLQNDGSFDSTFADNGVYVGLNTESWFRYPQDIKLQSDNKIVMASSVVGWLGVVRLNENGTLDNSFGSSGYVVTNVSGGSVAIDIQPDGKIVEVGAASTGGPNSFIKIVRYNTNGTMDNTFGSGGLVTSSISNYATYGNDITVQPLDNKIVVVGSSKSQSSGYNQSKFLVMRFDANGSLDTEFGPGPGYTMTQFDNSTVDGASNVYIISDGKIFVGGASQSSSNTYKSAMARYNSCGISVTTQPIYQTVQVGGTANFTVGSSSSSAIYQWQVLNSSSWVNISNGGQYSGAQTSTLQISNATTSNDQQRFRSAITSGFCSDTSQAAILTVTSGTGVNEIAARTGVKLYPNPVKDQFTIEFQNADYIVGHVRVMDALGRVIENLNIQGDKTVRIHSENWVRGIYLIEAIPQKGSPVLFKAVKQ